MRTIFTVCFLLLASSAYADDRRTADKLSDMIEDLARIEGAADGCGSVRDRIIELRGRMKALRDDLRGGGGDTRPPDDGPKAIDDAAFGKLQKRVDKETFSDGKQRVLREAASTNWFKAGQVGQLVAGITMGSDKLKALEVLAPRILDLENAFVIYKVFDFESDKKKAEQILKRVK